MEVVFRGCFFIIYEFSIVNKFFVYFNWLEWILVFVSKSIDRYVNK